MLYYPHEAINKHTRTQTEQENAGAAHHHSQRNQGGAVPEQRKT